MCTQPAQPVSGTFKRRVGQPVRCNGFPGTITRVCEWAPTMVEVRLARGTVCVPFSDCTPEDTRTYLEAERSALGAWKAR